MNEFGSALKKARKDRGKKLRDVADYIKKSIGYISDIEQGRKAPPDLGTVQELQGFLLVEDNHLVELAVKARTKRPSEVFQLIQGRPPLSELFFRVKDMSDEELEELIKRTDD